MTQAAPARRSVVFLHNSYYHFYYLAAALRRRGWDAVSVSLEGPQSSNQPFYHGEDVNLWHTWKPVREWRRRRFYAQVASRFRLVHFCGEGQMSFFPRQFDTPRRTREIAEFRDFASLRAKGVKIAYTIGGCKDGVAQSSVQAWSGVCDRCPWQANVDICSDEANLRWGRKLDHFCDLICTEGQPALDYEAGPKTYREPLTMVSEASLWRPDIEVPARYRIPREDGELLVYHSVGNFQQRTANGRNIKGTPAVMTAIERLQADGLKVKLTFVTDVPSRDVRYLQVQADVVVDQLNYGRYGATAREAMMLGKPTICFIQPNEPDPSEQLQSLAECPLVSATEETVYQRLKELLLDPERRARLGVQGRAYALKWHDAAHNAARYEQVYDRLMAGLPVRGA